MVVEDLRAYKWLIEPDAPELTDEVGSNLKAQGVLRKIDALSKGSIGTHALYSVEDRGKLRALQVDLLGHVGKFTSIAGNHLTYACNSRWGAMALIYSLATKLAGRGAVVLFRGHADHRWDLMSSIDRPTLLADPSARDAELERTKDFVDHFNRERAAHGIPPSLLLGHAAAQHFGCKTSLLDWTYDPLVALWFATHRRNLPEEARDEGMPCIWMIALNHLLDDGLQVVLPEPSIRRIYDQRGVLLDTALSTGNWEQHAIQVIFEDEGKLTPRFNPFWQGIERRLYRPTEWLHGIQSRLDSGTVVYKVPRPNRDVWLSKAYGVLNSLCLICDNEGLNVQIEPKILEHIVQSNPYITALLAEAIETSDPTEPDSVIAHYIRSSLP